MLSSCGKSPSPVVDEYDVSQLATDFGGGEAYSIGANEKGMPIFKDLDEAYKQALIDYEEGFTAVAEEFDLKKVRKWRYELYEVYGIQLTTGTAEEKKQGKKITQFFDIYENSYE